MTVRGYDVSEDWSLTLVEEQTFVPHTIKLVRSCKDSFCWFCRSRDVSRVIFSMLSRHTRESVQARLCRDGLCAK